MYAHVGADDDVVVGADAVYPVSAAEAVSYHELHELDAGELL